MLGPLALMLSFLPFVLVVVVWWRSFDADSAVGPTRDAGPDTPSPCVVREPGITLPVPDKGKQWPIRNSTSFAAASTW